MIDPEAASVKIVDVPRLSVARLLDLRAFLDSGLSLGPWGSGSPREVLMAKHWTSAQPDLFEEPPQGIGSAPPSGRRPWNNSRCC